jgi:hypothetical protein
MKIGAGHKPQAYDAHGRYTGPNVGAQGGSVSLRDGSIRMYAQNGCAGGLNGGNEVRGPVTPPLADIIWKNDEPGKADPKPEDLQPQMREALENLRSKTKGLDSINVNSGRRPFDPQNPKDPHAEGRAVDINRINGFTVKDMSMAKGPEAERARNAAEALGQQVQADHNVNQFIGPNGGWNKDEDGRTAPLSSPRHRELLDRHKNHYHINVRRIVGPVRSQ